MHYFTYYSPFKHRHEYSYINTQGYKDWAIAYHARQVDGLDWTNNADQG
jgi:hypothetical protein